MIIIRIGQYIKKSPVTALNVFVGYQRSYENHKRRDANSQKYYIINWTEKKRCHGQLAKAFYQKVTYKLNVLAIMSKPLRC